MSAPIEAPMTMIAMGTRSPPPSIQRKGRSPFIVMAITPRTKPYAAPDFQVMRTEIARALITSKGR